MFDGRTLEVRSQKFICYYIHKSISESKVQYTLVVEIGKTFCTILISNVLFNEFKCLNMYLFEAVEKKMLLKCK